MPLQVWTDLKPDSPGRPILSAEASEHQITYNDSPNGAKALVDADVAFGQPDVKALLKSDRVKWVHITSAGYTRYDRDDLRASFRARGAQLTTSSGVFDQPCAQHVLAMMLSMNRQLPKAMALQGERKWDTPAVRRGSRLFEGQTVLIVGFGSIALALVEMLAPLRPTIIGVRRVPRGDEPIRMITTDNVDAALPTADHIVNLLPDSDSTNRFFDAGRIARFKRGALFYNVGRGSTVDSSALRAALESEVLAGAYLDVTHAEPLPAKDPLWTTKNCYITPHAAGGFEGERVALTTHFVANLRRFERGETLLNRVI